MLTTHNVPGAFSSADGEDFRAVLEETCRIADSTVSIPRPPAGRWEPAGTILGNGFSLAWRVLDAQYWGVPQRRKRIFLVADFGGYTAPKILFEQESLPGDPAAGRGTGQGTASAVEGGAGAAGGAPRKAVERITAFAANQRDEVRNLHDVAATLSAQPGMKQQTFIAGVAAKGDGGCFLSPEKHTTLSSGGGQAGQGYPCILAAAFSAGAGASAGSVGYSEEIAPTLKGAASGNSMPSVLCLNDQGCGSPVETSQPRAEKHRPSRQARPGGMLETCDGVAGTLRAQIKGHPPLVLGEQSLYENHAIDARYTGPHAVAPTMSARYGTGGNNQPLVLGEPTLFENHGMDTRYTGPHAVAPTMSAGYGTGGSTKPLVVQELQTFCISGNIVDREPHNGGNGFGCQEDVAYTLNTADRHAVFSRQRVDRFREDDVVSTQSARQHKDATELVCSPEQAAAKLIRRLTPLECERLQGFPDGWTALPGAADSARYKALGNSVAIPCVTYVLRGIVLACDEADSNANAGNSTE